MEMNNLEYLKVDESYAKQLSHSHSSLFRKIGTNKYMRYIVANQKYDQHEIDKLHHLKKALQDKHIQLPGNLNSESELMRFINGDCQISLAVDYIEKAIKYNQTPKLDLSIIQKKILEKGVVYFGGRDKLLRPTIIVQAHLINKNEVEEFKQGMIYMFESAIKYFFIDEYIENWNVIVETNNMSVLSINFSILGEIIQAMKYLFPSRLHNIFITNPSTSLSLSWSIISEFIDKYQLEQVQLISKSEFIKIKRFYNPEQLEKKYGGTLKNITQYWPPTNTLTQEYLSRYFNGNQPQDKQESTSQMNLDQPKFAENYYFPLNHSRSLTPEGSVTTQKQKQKIFGEYTLGKQRQSTLVMTSQQGKSMIAEQNYKNSALPYYNYQLPKNYSYFNNNYEFQFEKDEQFLSQQPRENFLSSYSQLMYQKKPKENQQKDRGCLCGFCKSQKKKNDQSHTINEQQQQEEQKINTCLIF